MRAVVLARAGFAAAWIATQAGLVVTAERRADNAFGFRMFGESSTLRIRLSRRVDSPTGHGTMLVEAPNGTWAAHDHEGTLRRFAWKDRVHEPALSTFDVTIHASYGASAQLARLEAALADVAAPVRLEGDVETHSLALEVVVRRNGREPTTTTLERAASP